MNTILIDPKTHFCIFALQFLPLFCNNPICRNLQKTGFIVFVSLDSYGHIRFIYSQNDKLYTVSQDSCVISIGKLNHKCCHGKVTPNKKMLSKISGDAKTTNVETFFIQKYTYAFVTQKEII